MITVKQFDGKCWICNSNADSKEHRYKKTDLKRGFDVSSQNNDKIAFIIRDNSKIEVQGPNSNKLKFKKVICQNCNNNYTQPFDLAYDRFCNYILMNIDYLVENKSINFNLIYPNNTKIQINNLYKYYLKHIGCRLAENNIEIEANFVEFIKDNHQNLDTLLIKFEIKYGLYILLKKFKEEDFMYSNLYKGPLSSVFELEKEEIITSMYTYYTNQWFKTHFVYSNLFDKQTKNWMKKYYSDSIIPIIISEENIDTKYINSMSIDQIVNSLSNNNQMETMNFSLLIEEMLKSPYI